MIILDNVVVTDEFLNAQFCCCLPRCKGWCCVAGDAGAPLEAEEIQQIEDNLEAIKPYMRPEGIKVVEENDVYDYDETGELVKTARLFVLLRRLILRANATSGSLSRAIYTQFVWWKRMVSRMSFTMSGAFVCPLNVKASTRASRSGNSSKHR